MANTKYMRGLDDALRTMRRLRQDTAPALVKALNQGVEEVADRARVLAQDSRQSGALIDSIRTDFAASTDQLAVGRTVRLVRGARIVARAYVGAFYSRFVEFGAAGRAAKPFFFPAVRSVQRRVTRRVTRALKAAAKAAARVG